MFLCFVYLVLLRFLLYVDPGIHIHVDMLALISIFKYKYKYFVENVYMIVYMLKKLIIIKKNIGSFLIFIYSLHWKVTL